MTKTLQELIDASIFISTEYQAVLAELSQGAEWDVDFSAPSFTLQTTPPVTLTPYLLGTESASRGSFVWSWRELGHFNPRVVSAAVQAEQAGKRQDVAELVTDELPLQEGLARRLTLAAKAVTGLYAHYPARAGGNITAWLLLDGPQFELPRLTEQRMMQVIGESLTTDTAVDHNLAVASYAALRGAHVEWDTDATCVVTVHDGAQRFWFDDHQITGVEPAEPSVGEDELRELERQARTRREALLEDRRAAEVRAEQLGHEQREAAAERKRREREEAAAAAASAPVAETVSEDAEPLPSELSPEEIEAPEPEQPADDVAVPASTLRETDQPFDQEPTHEPAAPGRVETRVLPGPQSDSLTAGPAASPNPDTTAMSRIPDPEFAAGQPSTQDADRVDTAARDTVPARGEERVERETVVEEEVVVREDTTRTPERERPVAADRARAQDRFGRDERVAREERLPYEAHEEVVERETVAGPGAPEDDLSAPAVVDGEEVETNEQAERKGKKKRGFLSRFFDL
ncbi:hypothetical protein KVA01_02200 [Kocuria varians]|uniref:Hydrolase n=1 Tax=Kocuria varians TaxID=1272 RepID=A0A4Y4CYQ4_KOCVA|nr:DUF6882 domain-containing protein [Kocuria varians]GEC98065.1 hypothetical protein KVA01_02200 [Kocuria varians]